MNWYLSKGCQGDIIISSRVRLARNLPDISFPRKLSADEKMKIREKIENALVPANLIQVHMEDLSGIDRRCLVEKHLISEELAEYGDGKSVCISRDESIGVMINEEDHIRVQAMEAGYSVQEAYKKAMEVCVLLEQTLPIAYSQKYGFLTACPTNTGTGLRASVMAHLPALVMTGKIQSLMEGLTKNHFTVRGHLGENSKADGNLFQISNQVTLGISEPDILQGFSQMIDSILKAERQLREKIYEEAPERLEDTVYRSYGNLLYSRTMTSQEASLRISDLRLGISLGFFKDADETLLARISYETSPAVLQKENLSGRQKEEDSLRSEKIKKLLRDCDRIM